MKTTGKKSLLLLIGILFISIASAQDAFITTWQIFSSNESIYIPTYSGETYNYDVDWGDGNTTTGHTGNATHTYTSSGSYQVSITGEFPRIYFNNIFDTNKVKIYSIDQWGDQIWSSMDRAFSGCTNLAGQANDIPDLSICTSLESMFSHCSSFNQDIGDWDLSNITDISAMFYQATVFNQDIGDWDVSNVVDMGDLFRDGIFFNQDIGGWNTSNLEIIYGMFYGATSFNQNIGNWDVSNVIIFRNVFFDAISFNQDIGNWDVSSAVYMDNMFYRASSFNQDIGSWDVSSVIDMNDMFCFCENFNQPLENWNVTNVNDMSGMFFYCEDFNQDIGSWNVSGVSDMTNMFYHAHAFDQDIGNWDVSSVNDMSGMFVEAFAFNQDISNWDVSYVLTMETMFMRATSFDQDIGNWNVSNVINMDYMFSGVTLSTINYDLLLIGWAALNLHNNIEFDGGYSQYCLGESARQSIISDFAWSFDDNGVDPSCDLSISCTSLTIPLNGSIDVYITTSLSWNEVPEASGYNLTISTTSGGNDLYDNYDVGNVTIFDPSDFPCASEIFVTIVPYNATGSAIDCIEESFTTEEIIANAGDDATICLGESTQLQASGGTEYSWLPTEGLDNPNISNPNASPSSTTIYTVTVSTGNGCEETDQVTVTVHPAPIPNASATDETANGSNDGTATCAPSNGSTPYLYAWSNGENTQTITDLPPGDYTVTLTDANGCFSSETVTVHEFICPELTIIVDKEDVTCFGDCNGSIELSGVTNGVAPFAYSWSTGESSSVVENLCAGDYSVTIIDADNCSITGSFTIGNPVLLVANATATDESGNGLNDGTATADPTGGTPPYFYLWSNGETTQSIDNLSPGTYSITVDDYNGCVSIESVVVNSVGCDPIVIDSDTYDASCYGFCDGGIFVTITSGGTAPFEFQWSNGASTQNLQGVCEGLYGLTITDSENCTTFESFYIEEPDPIVVNASSTHETANNANDGTATCNPEGGSQPYSYNWSNGETTQSIENLAPGYYVITLYDANYCLAIDTVTVNDFSCSDMTITTELQNNKCKGECKGSLLILEVVNGIEPISYSWSTGSTEAGITDLCAGLYALTIDDAAGCTLIDSFTISEPQELILSFNATDASTVISNDGSAEVIATGGFQPYEYLWNTGANTATIEDIVPAVYSVTVTDANGCMKMDSVEIGFEGCHELELDYQMIDETCYMSCDGVIAICDVINSSHPLNFEWNNGSTSTIINNLCGGDYMLTVTDSEGCELIDTITIGQINEIIIEVDSVIHITDEGLGAIIVSTNDNGSYSYEWTGADGFYSEQLLILNLNKEGCYSLTITDQVSGCQRDSTICIDDLTNFGTVPYPDEEINVYPIPANDKIVIEFKQTGNSVATISLFAANGALVLRKDREILDNKIIMETSNYEAGLYLLVVGMEGKGMTQKKIVLVH